MLLTSCIVHFLTVALDLRLDYFDGLKKRKLVVSIKYSFHQMPTFKSILNEPILLRL